MIAEYKANNPFPDSFMMEITVVVLNATGFYVVRTSVMKEFRYLKKYTWSAFKTIRSARSLYFFCIVFVHSSVKEVLFQKSSARQKTTKN